MIMSVFIPIPIKELQFEGEQPSRTYRLDLERGRIFPVGTCDGIDAVRQFIKKTLISPRFRCLVYDNQYGSELKQTIIAGDATPEFVETEIPRLVRDALLVDSRIFDVFGFSISFETENAEIGFTAHTVFGHINVRSGRSPNGELLDHASWEVI